jgi:hypothetical protein
MARNRNPLPIPPMECPLGDEHCDLLDQTLQSCNSLNCYLDKLQALGLDVSAWRQESIANESLAKALKEIHFPDRS